MNTGTVVQVIGAVIDVRFPDEIPAIYNALKVRVGENEVICEVQQHLGDDKVRAVAMDATDGLARGVEVIDTGAPMTVPVGEVTLGRLIDVNGNTIDKGEPLDGRRALADPPAGPGVRRARSDRRAVRDRHQGRRPARPLRQGRQDRPLRRRRRGQDRHRAGAHQQHRDAARRVLRLLRRGRAHPRGQRPLDRDAGVRRPRQDGSDLRPDERAPGRTPARRPRRPHRGGVLPRGRRPGRAALHRQHLPLRPGGLRGLGAPRPYAERRGLPAHAGQRDGRAAGAHHVHQARVGHLGAGDLRARRRPHRPGAGRDLHPPRRHHHSLPRDLREGHLPGRRPARLELAHPHA